MSKVEVNQVSSQCGSTLTIGQSGDTVQLASGATQTGFGRTGTVDWDTTVKTASFTAENGKGYFVNTTSAAITVTLPASPSAGNIVAVMDYANTAATNPITVARNGSKIDGETIDATMKTNGESFTLVYVDSTEGWKTVNNASAQINTALFVAATGGTITTCGDFKIHTFTSPGTFTVTCAGNSGGSTTLDYLVVAGGGGAGSRDNNNGPAGGGAGGFRYSAATFTSPSCAPGHPLRSPTGITAAAQGYPITVGAGGAGSTDTSVPGAPGSQGANSVFSTITSAGGGFGAKAGCTGCGSGDGGSGGGNPSNADHSSTPSYVGAGNTPPVSPPQGNPGGTSTTDNDGSGGGGAGAKAPDNPPGPCAAGGGGAGAGIPTAFGSNGEPCGSFRYYAGGGAGGARQEPGASVQPGGIGGGGDASTPSATGNATANTGGGGGGGRGYPNPPAVALYGGSGGSGIVVIRYKFQ